MNLSSYMHLTIGIHGIWTGLERDCIFDSGELTLGNFCFSEVTLESPVLWYKPDILLIAYRENNLMGKSKILICGTRFMGKLRWAY